MKFRYLVYRHYTLTNKMTFHAGFKSHSKALLYIRIAIDYIRLTDKKKRSIAFYLKDTKSICNSSRNKSKVYYDCLL